MKAAPKPPRSLLDPRFRYTNSANTDLRRTFARIRREQRAAQRAKPADNVLLFGAAAREAS